MAILTKALALLLLAAFLMVVTAKEPPAGQVGESSAIEDVGKWLGNPPLDPHYVGLEATSKPVVAGMPLGYATKKGDDHTSKPTSKPMSKNGDDETSKPTSKPMKNGDTYTSKPTSKPMKNGDTYTSTPKAKTAVGSLSHEVKVYPASSAAGSTVTVLDLTDASYSDSDSITPPPTTGKP